MDAGDVLTPTQVGEILQIPMKTMAALCRRGDIPGARKVGHQWRIPRWEVDAMFAQESNRENARTAPASNVERHSTATRARAEASIPSFPASL